MDKSKVTRFLWPTVYSKYCIITVKKRSWNDAFHMLDLRLLYELYLISEQDRCC